jgi:chromosome partitioning protein
MCGNIAYELQQFGNTLMIDADPQANLTSWWFQDAFEYDIVDVLRGDVNAAEAAQQVRDKLWIIPTAALESELSVYAERELPSQPFAFQTVVESLQGAGFEYLLFDTGPGMGTLQQNVTAVADTVIGITVPEYFGYDGIETYMDQLQTVKRNRRATFDDSRMILNRVNRSFSVHNAFAGKIAEEFAFRLFTVGQSVAFSDAVVYHRALQEHAPGNRYTTAINEIAHSLVTERVHYASAKEE